MKNRNLFGVAFYKDGWMVEYRKEKFPVLNDLYSPHDRRYLAVGRDENKRVFFDLDCGKAIITRIGCIRPEMAASLREFCQKPRDAFRFGTKGSRPVPTIDRQTMLDARLIRTDDNKFVSSR
jgi:hypothetical protein